MPVLIGRHIAVIDNLWPAQGPCADAPREARSRGPPKEYSCWDHTTRLSSLRDSRGRPAREPLQYNPRCSPAWSGSSRTRSSSNRRSGHRNRWRAGKCSQLYSCGCSIIFAPAPAPGRRTAPAGNRLPVAAANPRPGRHPERSTPITLLPLPPKTCDVSSYKGSPRATLRLGGSFHVKFCAR